MNTSIDIHVVNFNIFATQLNYYAVFIHGHGQYVT